MENTQAIYEEFKGGICGGGYTDKYGVTWDWLGIYPDCKYMPRICKECSGSGQAEPPEDNMRLVFKGVSSEKIYKTLQQRTQARER